MPYGCNVCVSSFQTFLSSVGFKKSFLSLQKIIIKTNLLCCPAPFLQYRFCGLLFCSVYSELRFCGSAFCCFFLFPFPLFCFSDSVYLAFFLSFSSAMFLLPRFSCSVFQSAKSLKKCFKKFYGLAKSVSRPYPYHIYSNFIQSYSKNQDSICFFSRLLLLLVLLLKRAALLKVEPPVLY